MMRLLNLLRWSLVGTLLPSGAILPDVAFAGGPGFFVKIRLGWGVAASVVAG